jgi:hypothetical protein
MLVENKGEQEFGGIDSSSFCAYVNRAQMAASRFELTICVIIGNLPQW